MVQIKNGNEIKALLLKKGITIDDIARDFGLHKTTVVRYFTNELNMSAKFLFNLADYSKLNVYKFVEHDDGKPVNQYKEKPKQIELDTSKIQETISSLKEKINSLSLEIERLRNHS